jgi:putative tricarboxylic transport membrane protein
MLRRLAAAAPFGLIGLAAILLARDFPPIPGQVYGPALFPVALGAGLALCAILVALQAPVPAGAPATVRGRIAALGAALAPLLVMLGWDVMGWPLMAFGLGAALLMLAGTRPVPALLAGAAVAALTWVIFAMVLRVPLPRGLLTFLPY